MKIAIYVAKILVIKKYIMFNYLRKKLFNRIFIQQLFFKIYLNVFSKKNIKDLFDNGYSIHDEKFPFKEINLNKYLKYSNYNFVMNKKKIEIVDLKKIYAILFKLGVISLIKDYLGRRVYAYDNSVLTLGNKICNKDSMQPHHDSKFRRIKIYIWLNDKNINTHPLYYLRKTHKQIKNWDKYEETRFPNIDEKKFDKVYGEKGSIIIFDTHGIHSHFKTTIIPRSVIELTFESFGFFNRLNKKNIKDETIRLNLIDLDKLIH
jgi:hypothetical protein